MSDIRGRFWGGVINYYEDISKKKIMIWNSTKALTVSWNSAVHINNFTIFNVNHDLVGGVTF